LGQPIIKNNTNIKIIKGVIDLVILSSIRNLSKVSLQKLPVRIQPL
jgi:hypothetical protein